MKTLLIVDDSPEMRRLMRQVAAKACDEVFECEDGDQVLAAFDSYHPDWVVMDVEMKRVDGLSATSTLLRLHPEAKVIIVTKYTDPVTRQAAQEAGALYFLGKDDLLSLRALIQTH